MKKLMIVDDEFLVRVGIASLLKWEEYGYTIVAEAENGEEALKKIEAVRPQIVLTDLMMQPGDGFELIETCLRKYPEMKFIVLSNYNDFDNVRKAMKLGAKDYIFKLTLKPKELLEILEEVGKDLKETAENKKAAAKKNAAVIKKDLLEKLMNARDRHYEELLKALKKFPLELDLEKPYGVLSITIDNFQVIRRRGNFLESDLLKFTMENMIHEIFGGQGKNETFQHGECGFLLLFSEETGYRERIREKFETLCQCAVQYYGVSISGVVSRTGMGAGCLKNLILENGKMRELQFWNKEKRLLWGEERERVKKDSPGEVFREAELEERMKLYGPLEGLHYAEELLERLRESPYCDSGELRKALIRMARILSYHLNREGVDTEHIADKNGVNLETAILEYDYFEDILGSFLYLETQYREIFREKKGRPLRREILEVKKYVQEHFKENLYVAQIAKMVNMSESRFSHVFKKEMEISFWEYVNQVRMEEAGKLLLETDLRIGDIADKIGMENPNYFSTQFKKWAGVTPMEYRRAAENRKKSAEKQSFSK